MSFDPESAAWAEAALQAFDQLVQSESDFRSRPGQRLMAAEVARVFSAADLGKPDKNASAADDDTASADDEPTRAIAVIQAGTGVGKSLAYCAPAIALALARGTRVLISTATVALQEQLVSKDLPRLAAQMAQPFRFALAKGRGRYVCKLKLNQLAGGTAPDPDDLFADEEPEPSRRRPQDTEARVQFYASMARDLASGAWLGDRDTLETPPEPELWQPVAAESRSCTGKHCPQFSECTY